MEKVSEMKRSPGSAWPGRVVDAEEARGLALETKGNEIHYGPETKLNFTLTNSVTL